MKVVLLEDVKKVGKKGEIVEVSDASVSYTHLLITLVRIGIRKIVNTLSTDAPPFCT